MRKSPQREKSKQDIVQIFGNSSFSFLVVRPKNRRAMEISAAGWESLQICTLHDAVGVWDGIGFSSEVFQFIGLSRM